VQRIEVAASGLLGHVMQRGHALAVAGGQFVLLDLRVADCINQRIGSLCCCNGVDLVVSAGIFFPVGEENQRLPMSGVGGKLSATLPKTAS